MYRLAILVGLAMALAVTLPDSTAATPFSEVKKLTTFDAEAGDLFGKSVAISGDTAIVGAWKEDAGGANAGAVYVFQRGEGGADNWGEVKKLTASDPDANDRFGVSVAVSDDTAVVGAYLEDAGGTNAGAAYVFHRNEGGADNWGQVTKLTASDAEASDSFGVSVAVGGDIVVVGASLEDAEGTDAGAAYVFRRNEGGADDWGQLTKLSASDAQNLDFFGVSVAVSDDTAVVGAPGEDTGGTNAGAVYVFQRDEGGADSWGEVTKLAASDAQAGDVFGVSVAGSGDTTVVGALGEDDGGTNAGAAYVFHRNEGGADNWGQVTKLSASDAEASDSFGVSVAVGGDIVVVGASLEDAEGTDAGAAYVFRRNEGGADDWGQLTKLSASDAQNLDFFGVSVAVSDDTAVVGAPGEDTGGTNAGAVYVFQRDEGGADSWGEVTKLAASDAQAGDVFGVSVAGSGDTAVVGALGEDDGGANAGAAYVFHRNEGGADSWGQVTKLTAADAQNDDEFGYSVAVSGDTAVVGAYLEDASGTFAGAAYVFQRDEGGADSWGQVAKLTASDAHAFDFFGTSVAVSGDTTVVGAESEDPGARSNAGAAYVFEREPGPPLATPPGDVRGDVNCDGVVGAIDAALILQFSAALLESLPCVGAADVNGDGVANPLDAALILQLSAGLLDSLSP